MRNHDNVPNASAVKNELAFHSRSDMRLETQSLEEDLRCMISGCDFGGNSFPHQ